jgi:mannose-1-phosphate guanylyltransferase
MNNNYAIIMAGGIGSRFWPLSKTNHPKQFIDILGTGQTFIQQTFSRLNKIIPAENIYIVSNVLYKELIKTQIPGITDDQILLEPAMRNTAPCIAYATYKIMSKNPNANFVVAPSDHLILKEQDFVDTIAKGLEFTAQNEALLTLGITPSRPETGYGYIQATTTSTVTTGDLTKVKTFTEKPNLDLAKVFCDSGEFFWNSGIFLWKGSTITKAFESLQPDIATQFSEGTPLYYTAEEDAFIGKAYPSCKNISIDYGIMEKANNVFVLISEFGWSDLGTWGSLYEHSEKDANANAIDKNNVLCYDSKDNIVKTTDGKLVVIQGLEGYIVAETETTILICKKEEEQRIKQFVNDVKISKGNSYI